MLILLYVQQGNEIEVMRNYALLLLKEPYRGTIIGVFRSRDGPDLVRWRTL